MEIEGVERKWQEGEGRVREGGSLIVRRQEEGRDGWRDGDRE